MPENEAVGRLSPDVEQLLEDESAGKALRRSADKLRAYEQSRKRRVKASRDEKQRTQVIDAMRALGDGVNS